MTSLSAAGAWVAYDISEWSRGLRCLWQVLVQLVPVWFMTYLSEAEASDVYDKS